MDSVGDQCIAIVPNAMGKVNVNDILIEYGDTNEDECRANEEDGLYSHIDRMIYTLRYYSKVDVVNKRADKEQFLEFVDETYVSLLKDYVRIMERHRDADGSEKDIELIQKRKAKQFRLLCACSSENCFMLFRHHKGAKMEAPKMEKLSLFRHLMDSIHCYLVHSFDIGLRLRIYEQSDARPKKPKWSNDSDVQFEFKGRMRVNRHWVDVFATKDAQARSG